MERIIPGRSQKEKERTFEWIMDSLVIPLLETWGTRKNAIIAVNQWTNLGKVVADNIEEQSGFSVGRIRKLAALWPERSEMFTPDNVVSLMEERCPQVLRNIRAHPEGDRWLREMAIPSIKQELLL